MNSAHVSSTTEHRLTSPRHDWTVIGLVGLVHGSSHFFQLVLPTLYLSLAHEFGYDFTQLGLLASVFFLISCLGQASSGFIVDRIGGAPVLYFGLSLFIVSGLLIGISTSYGMLLTAAVVGGVGNSIFHPVDFSIINQQVSVRRLGHAFSIHGLTGNLGWALTPIFMATLIHFFNWRVAAFGASAAIAVVLGIAVLGYGRLASTRQAPVEPEASDVGPAALDLSRQSVWNILVTLLAQPALWGAFLFLACASIASSAVQNYTIPMLNQVYGIDKVLAGTTLSAYMLAAAFGMLAGGFLVSTTPKTERTIAASLVMAGFLLVVLASGLVSASLSMPLVALAGFCSGIATPSRDMLIRRVTPKGATGTVYGLVYSGMDVGSSVGPAAFGILLDLGYSKAPWVGAGIAFVAAAVFALWVAHAAMADQRQPLQARGVA